MVQLSYFGDKRDLFKYDLITSILKEELFQNYVFVPMLTIPRVDNEGKKRPLDSEGKSKELLDFIEKCRDKGRSLDYWEYWLSQYVASYQTRQPVDKIFFTDETRTKYWRRFEPIIRLNKSLVFFDPDTGLETGTPAELKSKGIDKYLLNDELRDIVGILHPTSTLMIYQHLQPNKLKHIEGVKKKLQQICDEVCNKVNSEIYACAYREDDLAFLFISKTKHVHNNVYAVLQGYKKVSKNRYKYLLVA